MKRKRAPDQFALRRRSAPTKIGFETLSERELRRRLRRKSNDGRQDPSARTGRPTSRRECQVVRLPQRKDSVPSLTEGFGDGGFRSARCRSSSPNRQDFGTRPGAAQAAKRQQTRSFCRCGAPSPRRDGRHPLPGNRRDQGLRPLSIQQAKNRFCADENGRSPLTTSPSGTSRAKNAASSSFATRKRRTETAARPTDGGRTAANLGPPELPRGGRPADTGLTREGGIDQ